MSRGQEQCPGLGLYYANWEWGDGDLHSKDKVLVVAGRLIRSMGHVIPSAFIAFSLWSLSNVFVLNVAILTNIITSIPGALLASFVFLLTPFLPGIYQLQSMMEFVFYHIGS